MSKHISFKGICFRPFFLDKKRIMEKITAKLFIKVTTEIKDLMSISNNPYGKDYTYETRNTAKKIAEHLQLQLNEQTDQVLISYYIGSRSYYHEVTKIGKSYFHRGLKMTKCRGYWGIQEIDTITDKMSNEMISDSYYY